MEGNIYLGNNKDFSIVNSYLVFLTLLLYAGIVYMGIWSFQNNNLAVLGVAFISFIMTTSAIVFNIIFSNGNIFRTGSFTSSSFSFLLGFSFWGLILLLSNNNFSVLQNTLYSTISTTIPKFYDFIFNVFVIPLSEEFFWVVAVPSAFIFSLKPSFKNNNFVSKIIVFFIIIVVAGFTFSLFHINGNILFYISSFAFRSFMIFMIVGDELFNVVPRLKILVPFSMGAHIVNNWSYYGFKEGFMVLLEGGFTGILILTFLLLTFIFGVQYIYNFIKYKKI